LITKCTVTLPGLAQPVRCHFSNGNWFADLTGRDFWLGMGPTIEAAILNKIPNYDEEEENSHAE
jgi:hypothetical protein